jgi:hypothetical protein
LLDRALSDQTRYPVDMGPLYSIPESPPPLIQVEGLATPEGKHAKPGKEVTNMSKGKFTAKLRRSIDRFHVLIVSALSVLHVGLACLHTRDSGRADSHPCIA